MRKLLLVCLMLALITQISYTQERSIIIPKRISGAPFKTNDHSDLFGKAYRWSIDGNYDWAADSLKKLIDQAGIKLDPQAYYVVVANYTDKFSPIGLIHGDDSFLSSRMYGLTENNLYYIFISRTPQAPSFLSVIATEKQAPFWNNLPAFLSLLPFTGLSVQTISDEKDTWIDVQQFTIPGNYRKNCNLSFLVKTKLAAEDLLATAIFDNTSLERWSYGIGTAITTVNDVDFIIGNDGTITVRPKPNKDLAAFALINYHFKPVDTKAKRLATSFHLLAGFRMSQTLEPIVGIGAGIPLQQIDLHLFAGYSVEFANELKNGYQIGEKLKDEINPFKLKIRGKPRLGIEIKFP